MLAFLQQLEHLGRLFLLSTLARIPDDLKIDFVLRSVLAHAQKRRCRSTHLTHQRNGQSSKRSAEQHQGRGNPQVQPETGVIGILPLLFCHKHHREKGDGRRLHQRQPAESEKDNFGQPKHDGALGEGGIAGRMRCHEDRSVGQHTRYRAIVTESCRFQSVCLVHAGNNGGRVGMRSGCRDVARRRISSERYGGNGKSDRKAPLLFPNIRLEQDSSSIQNAELRMTTNQVAFFAGHPRVQKTGRARTLDTRLAPCRSYSAHLLRFVSTPH